MGWLLKNVDCLDFKNRRIGISGHSFRLVSEPRNMFNDARGTGIEKRQRRPATKRRPQRNWRKPLGREETVNVATRSAWGGGGGDTDARGKDTVDPEGEDHPEEQPSRVRSRSQAEPSRSPAAKQTCQEGKDVHGRNRTNMSVAVAR